MSPESWLASAIADAERRGLAAMKPMLESLARSLAALRAADAAHREQERQLAADQGPPASPTSQPPQPSQPSQQ
jgi:hypothetical protein